MSANQKTRLLVAAKDLVRALGRESQKDEDLLPVLGALQFELIAARRTSISTAKESGFRGNGHGRSEN